MSFFCADQDSLQSIFYCIHTFDISAVVGSRSEDPEMPKA